ncbi:MAG: M12 family metallopeptidase [Proteobacteria bacterium]|nr:M12 family metallopeptidase [Pseudomonadota bacterium]
MLAISIGACNRSKHTNSSIPISATPPSPVQKGNGQKPVDSKCATKASKHTQSGFSLFAKSSSLWPKENGQVIIRVCWQSFTGGRSYPVSNLAPDLAKVLPERKKWVQEIIESQWNRSTGVNFTGWQECGTAPADFSIVPIDSTIKAPNSSIPGQPYVDALGADIKGKQLYLNLLFGDEVLYSSRYQQVSGTAYQASNDVRWFLPTACAKDLNRAWSTNNTATDNRHRVDINDPKQFSEFMKIYQSCLQNIVLHEFGHVLGFAHEQYRTDDEMKRQACATKISANGVTDDFNNVAQIYMGDKPLGPFDAESIMSYCRVDGTPTLTEEDIAMTRAVYGLTAVSTKDTSEQTNDETEQSQCP